MSASPYTWEQWQERFITTLCNYDTEQSDMAEYRHHWQQGEDPITAAEMHMEALQNAEEE